MDMADLSQRGPCFTILCNFSYHRFSFYSTFHQNTISFFSNDLLWLTLPMKVSVTDYGITLQSEVFPKIVSLKKFVKSIFWWSIVKNLRETTFSAAIIKLPIISTQIYQFVGLSMSTNIDSNKNIRNKLIEGKEDSGVVAKLAESGHIDMPWVRERLPSS